MAKTPPNPSDPADTSPIHSDTHRRQQTKAKTKKAQRFSKEDSFYSQNLQGSGKNKKQGTGPYKFDYIINLMETKGIDVYIIQTQETWLPNNFTTVINGYYIFHHGSEASDSNGGEGEQTNPTPRSAERGHTRGRVALLYHPRQHQLGRGQGSMN
eukprot:scaffold293198_cov40-Attheya_sp.AAC.2